MSFSSRTNNKENNIYVMGKDFIQGINDATLYAEKVFHNNFTDPRKKSVLSLSVIIRIYLLTAIKN